MPTVVLVVSFAPRDAHLWSARIAVVGVRFPATADGGRVGCRGRLQ
jgi:hypothetical protein